MVIKEQNFALFKLYLCLGLALETGNADSASHSDEAADRGITRKSISFCCN